MNCICIYPRNMSIYKFMHGKQIRQFEWHPYCGPTLHNKKGDPATNQPMWFLRLATKWDWAGRPLDESGIFADFKKIRNDN